MDIKGKIVDRSFTLESNNIQADKTIQLSFSSEQPVKREIYGETVYEVLDHSPNSVDMSRLNDGAPLLWNHNNDKMLGSVENARIDTDKKGRALVRFGNTEFARQVWEDVSQGIVKKVSVRYTIDDFKEETGKNNIPTYRITQWTPSEISLVSVPADNTVGIGRSEDAPTKPEADVQVVIETKEQPEVVPQVEARTQEPIISNTQPRIEITRSGEVKMNELELQKAERQRMKDITTLTDKMTAYVDGIRELHNKAIDDGMSAEAYSAELMRNMKKEPVVAIKSPAELGLSDKEKKQYSISRAIMGQVQNSGIDNSFELELSNQVAKNVKQMPKGLFIPLDVQMRKNEIKRQQNRAYSVGTANLGGNLVQTDVLASSFIDLLRNRTVTDKVGVKFMTGLEGNVAVPKRLTSSTAAWVSETGLGAITSGTFGQVTLSPKQLRVASEFSRQLLIQGNPDIEGLVVDDLTQDIAIEIDRAFFYGSGSAQSQPLGLKYTGGAYSSSLGTGSWANVVELQKRVSLANADTNSSFYVCNPTLYAGLMVSSKTNLTSPSATYPVSTFVLDAQTSTMGGYPVVKSNQIEDGYLFFGDFNQGIIGNWGVLDLLTDPYTGAANSLIRVWSYVFVDVAFRQPGAFAFANGMAFFG